MKFTVVVRTIFVLLIAVGVHAQQPTVIDGAVSPELIPDNRAYSMLFRLIANRTGQERAAMRAYLEQIGFTGNDCTACPTGPTQAEAQIDELFDIAQEFHAGIESLSQTAGPLEQARERLSADVAASLPSRLGPSDAAQLQLHIQRMKRNMKIFIH